MLPGNAYLSPGRSGKSPSGRDQIVEPSIPERWVDAGLAYLAQKRHTLGSRFVNKDRNVSIADKAPVFQPLLD